MATSKKLTARQLRFVEQYLVDLNATQAAIRAGYKPKAAGQQGNENLKKPQIAAAIKKALDARSHRIGITADRVLAETEIIGFSDIRHYAIDDAGRLQLAEGAPEGAARAVAKVKFKSITKEIPRGKGEPLVVTERETEIALWNKPEMLKLAGRHVDVHGFFDRMELTGKNGRPLQVVDADELTDEQLKARIAELTAKL